MTIHASTFASTGLAALSLVMVHLRDAMRMADTQSAERREVESDIRDYLSGVPFVNGDAGEVFR